MEPDWNVEDPVLDEETGARNYTIRNGNTVCTFAVIPVSGEAGFPEYVMQLGIDPTTEVNPDFEPYATADEAYRAGLRACRQLFESRGE